MKKMKAPAQVVVAAADLRPGGQIMLCEGGIEQVPGRVDYASPLVVVVTDVKGRVHSFAWCDGTWFCTFTASRNGKSYAPRPGSLFDQRGAKIRGGS